MAEDFTSLSPEALRQRLKSALTIQRTVVGIFTIILLAWIVLGFWRTNIPVFIVGVAMAMAAVAATSVSPRALKAELRRRDTAV